MVRENMNARPPRFAFLCTKRAVALLSVITCALIVIIALAATNVIHPGSSSGTTTNSGAASVTATSPHIYTTTSLTPSSSDSSNTANVNDPNAPLRIMALGASVVKGETSPGTVGFRKPMRDSLVDLGFTVNMVGAVRLGDMIDNDVEAYGGRKITEMHEYATQSVPETLPNMFVINLGTNNVLQNIDVDIAGQQMGDLINYLLTASNRSVVILSTLLTNTVPDAEPKVLQINEQYRSLMPGFEAENKSVVLVEMHPSEGVITDVPTIDDIGPDGSHPTEEGYAMMARRFIIGIQDARNKGFIQTPVDNGIPNDGDAERAGESTST
ncbi:carbohydrate esterase family 3 protein [Camillea tinctor]|nr:carbohydrate esterase family 3 protein [Camillea tinctor]